MYSSNLNSNANTILDMNEMSGTLYTQTNTPVYTPTFTITPTFSSSQTFTYTITQTYTSTPASAWWTPTPIYTMTWPALPYPAIFTENPTPVLIPVLTPESGWIQEPNVLQFPDGFHMFYTGGGENGTYESIFLATAPQPEGPWTRYASHPIIGSGYGGITGGCAMSAQIKIGNQYRVYFKNLTDSKVYYEYSTDGYNYTLNPTPVISQSDFTANIGCTPEGINGLEPVLDPNTGNYYAIIEVASGSCFTPPYVMFAVLSTDGANTFHLISNTPLTSMQPTGLGYNPLYAGGRATFYVNGHWASFPHIDGPTWIGYSKSPDYFNWVTDYVCRDYTGAYAVVKVGGDHNLSNVWGLTACDQAADSSIIEYNGNSYLFHSHDDNTNNNGRIGYSKFSGTLADYDSGFIPSASPTITNTVTITPIVPTSTPTSVPTPFLTLQSCNYNSAIVEFPDDNGNSLTSWLLQYGLFFEHSQPLTQIYNQSTTANYFCWNICCLQSGTTYQARLTQYNPTYSSPIISNIINITPYASPTP
jgi:hypothetical protein